MNKWFSKRKKRENSSETKGKGSSRKGKSVKNLAIFCIMAILMMAMTITAFASEPITPDVAITTDMVAPIIDYVVQNIAAIMPVAIAVFGIMIGLALVPRIIRRFTSA